MTRRPLAIAITMTAIVLIAGCGGTSGQRDAAPGSPADLSAIDDAVPRAEPASRYGNPRSYEVFGRTYRTLASSADYSETGIASWYGTKFHGRATSSGERYDMYAMTAAHKSLPIPTYVRVENLDNGRSTVVRVNDRGPFHKGRIIDLSYAAATRLGIDKKGTGQVRVTALTPYQTLRGRSTPTRKASAKPAPPAIPSGNLYLQVGAFGSRDNAERVLTNVNGAMPGRVAVLLDPDGPALYRVRVGPLADNEAQQIKLKLASMGYLQTHMVFD